MTKKTWLKGALMIAASGTLFATLQSCLGDIIQRILVAVMFD